MAAHGEQEQKDQRRRQDGLPKAPEHHRVGDDRDQLLLGQFAETRVLAIEAGIGPRELVGAAEAGDQASPAANSAISIARSRTRLSIIGRNVSKTLSSPTR